MKNIRKFIHIQGTRSPLALSLARSCMAAITAQLMIWDGMGQNNGEGCGEVRTIHVDLKLLPTLALDGHDLVKLLARQVHLVKFIPIGS